MVRKRNRFNLLTPFQRGLFTALALVGILILANSVYLFGYTAWQDWGDLRARLVPFYQWMLLGHFGVGLLFTALAVWFVWLHLGSVKKHFRRGAVVTGSSAALGVVVLLVTGVFLLKQGAGEDNRWAFHAHRLAGVLGLGGYMVHRFYSWDPTPMRMRWMVGASIGVIAGAMGLMHSSALRGSPPPIVTYAQAFEEIDIRTDPFLPFEPLADIDPGATFFPSGATLASGERLDPHVIMPGPLPKPEDLRAEFVQKGFTSNHAVGAEDCRLCHQDVVAQWEQSAHRFSSFNNPFYTASVLGTRKDAGPQASQFCGGCHDPAVMLAGNFMEEIDQGSIAAQAGLTCNACHIVNRIHNVTGNGNYELADNGEDPYLFHGATEGWKLEFRKYLIKARPRDHKDYFLKPFYSEPEYCAACHKVNLDVPVNGYKWLRGQNEYDNWHDSGVSRNAARTFYLPPTARICQDCHMPSMQAPMGDLAAKGGFVRGHEFLAANTALPHVRGDTVALEKVEKFLQDGKLRVELFAMQHPREGLVMDYRAHPPELRPGDELILHVVVRNVGVGHTFPGGTNDSNQGWLQFEALDGDGARIKGSGFLNEEHFLDKETHAYSAIMLDGAGKPAMQRDAHKFHVAGHVRVIPPGNVDIARFRVVVPDSGHLDVHARLMWRKFNQTYNLFSFQELGLDPPVLPVTEIDGDHTRLSIGAQPTAAKVAPWVHYNDYGIGSLRQGDSKTALLAFGKVAELAPERVDGFRNQARVHLVVGDPAPARALLERCEELDPGNAQSKLWWAEYLKLEGELELAADLYEGVLESFPKDRDTWRRLSETQYRLSDYEASLNAALRVLQIDPEDVGAHYQRMLIYRATGNEAGEQHARAAFEKYRIDDNAFQLVKDWRLRDPIANREIEPLHVH